MIGETEATGVTGALEIAAQVQGARDLAAPGPAASETAAQGPEALADSDDHHHQLSGETQRRCPQRLYVYAGGLPGIIELLL